MDTLFGADPDDGGLFPSSDAGGRVDGLGISRLGAGTSDVTYRRASDGAKVTGELWSDGPEKGTVWVLCPRDYAPESGAVVVDLESYCERADLKAVLPDR